MKHWLRLITVAFFIATAHAADRPPLRIGWTAWSDAEAVTRLAADILESRLDQPVELVLLDIGIQYQGLANGDIDAMLMAWLPLTHKPYMDKLGDQVVNLGPLYTRARLGWVVPDYIPRDQLNSITDLEDRKVAAKLRNRIHGIDPGAGLMQASEQAIMDYGLDRYRLVSSSGAGMTAALSRAIKRKQWIVVTGWSPHWMFSRWELRYLEDPRNSLGGRERIHALVRRGFYQDFPVEVSEFLSRMYLPLEQLEALMNQATDTSYEQAVTQYIEEHPQRIDYWVTGKVD
jgi:glycine betaine/proline transport system substrate-binding protein